MALGPRIDLRQSQSLVMTPQLQQAIKLLALSNVEIEAFIAEELAKNPLLEATSSDDEGEAPAARNAPAPAGDGDEDPEPDRFGRADRQPWRQRGPTTRL